MTQDSFKRYKPWLVLLGLSVTVWIIGSMITYPPYARIGAFTFFILGAGSLVLGKDEIGEGAEESLEWETGESPELSGKHVRKPKAKKKKRKRKKPATPKA